MSEYVGTWIYDTAAAKGDYVQLMRLDARTEAGIGWGTHVGLGWAPTLQIRRPGDTTLVGIAGGSFEANATDPESAALFQIGNETTITFTAVGDSAQLYYSTTGWAVVGSKGVTIA